MSRPIWQQSWPPNISYLSLLNNRNKTYNDPLIKSQSISNQTVTGTKEDKQHALSFTITSYLAETSTASYATSTPTTTQSSNRIKGNRFRSERNQSRNKQNKQNVDLYLVKDSKGQTEVHKTTTDVQSADSLRSISHADKFESFKEKKLDDTTGFIDDNFLKNINSGDGLSNRSSLIPIHGKQSKIETLSESYQLLPNLIKQYQKIRNSLNPADLMPETTCLREGLFQHPLDCNKYYECVYDSNLNKFVSHAFECTIKVAFDKRIIGCSSLTDPTVCIQY